MGIITLTHQAQYFETVLPSGSDARWAHFEDPEDEAIDMAQWVKPEFGRSKVNSAGKELVAAYGAEDSDEIDFPSVLDAYGVVTNWRASHAFPLNTFQVTLRKRAKSVSEKAVVAQRLKRVLSLAAKLQREPNMALSQMHDIGGCRAVLPTVADVRRLAKLYQPQPAFIMVSERSIKVYDYIHRPKFDGYRGIHVVGRYWSYVASHTCWNGHRVEIQIRSKLQHAWATAVETVATFTGQPLKFGGGDPKWRRFFVLMSAVIADLEECPGVPGAPEDRHDLLRELNNLSQWLDVRNLLDGWRSALKVLPNKDIKKGSVFLVALNTKKRTIRVTGFSSRQQANAAYAEIERSKEPVDAVLASASSVSELRKAFPNYYSDTALFLWVLRDAFERR